MVYVGKIVNTHGLKGELRIISNLKEKNEVFIVNNTIIIDDKEYIIKSYRVHKNYDMVTLSDINNIDDAFDLKGKKVYVKRESMKTKFLYNDVIGMFAYDNDKLIGKIIDIEKGKQDLLIIKNNNKKILIPYVNEFIDKIEDSKVYIKMIEGLINED